MCSYNSLFLLTSDVSIGTSDTRADTIEYKGKDCLHLTTNIDGMIK